jgi:hypothetical protein
MITINSFSADKNIPITLVIEGTTPSELTLADITINYTSSNDVNPDVVDYNGTVTFYGTVADYDAFGDIDYKSHKITVTYGDVGEFHGFLLPDVYNNLNTGFHEYFSLNFESDISSLGRVDYEKETNVYSIQSILDDIKAKTNISDIVVNKSFAESLDTIFVYSLNFKNSDKEFESYLTVLHWICVTFSMKVILGWDNVLYVTSMELLNGTGAYPEYEDENIHKGIDETYTVGKTIDTVKVIVNNYALQGVDTDFSLGGSQKLLDQKPVQVRRGKHYAWSGVPKYFNTYFRQIYEFQAKQRIWHFNKYNAQNQLVDEFDETQYIVNGVPLAGAYPIAWGRMDGSNNKFEGMEQAIWFKLHNNGVNTTRITEMITCNLPNFLSRKNTFLFFNWEASCCLGYGDINSWDRGWSTDYDTNPDAAYSSNYDECAFAISPIIEDGKRTVTLGITIKFTDLQGKSMYWYPYGNNPVWTANNYEIAIPTNDELPEFTFGSMKTDGMISPRLEDGSIAIFENTPEGIWCRLPETLGTLEIKFGGTSNLATNFKSILFRNLQISTSVALTDVSKIDLSLEDVIYSNTTSSDVDKTVTMYMYSENLKSGMGQLFLNDTDHPIDTLSFNVETEKVEWHSIRIYSKSISKSKVYQDIFHLSDIKLNYDDRYFNGGEINLMSGIIRANYVKSNMNIGGEI